MTRSTSRYLFLSAALLAAPGAYAGASTDADPAAPVHQALEAQVGRTGDLQAGYEIRAGAPARDAAGLPLERRSDDRMSGSGGGRQDLSEVPRSANFTERELEYIQHGP